MIVDSADTETGRVTDIEWECVIEWGLTISDGITATLKELIIAEKLQRAP